MSDILDDRIRLGVNGGHVQGILTVADAKKAGSLLECFRAKARHGSQLDARFETSMPVAILDDFLRSAFVYSRDVSEQSPGRGVQVNANAIHTGFDSGLQSLHE